MLRGSIRPLVFSRVILAAFNGVGVDEVMGQDKDREECEFEWHVGGERGLQANRAGVL